MKPLTEITDAISFDEMGELYYTAEDGITTSLEDLAIAGEKSRERQVNLLFDDSVLNDGDMIYVRKFNGAIQWLKANRMHGAVKGSTWVDMSPNTRKKLDHEGPVAVASVVESSVEEEMAVQEPEQFENGWYQDDKGNLHKFENGAWTAGAPSIDKLEYLG